jgi:hypothetical protein
MSKLLARLSDATRSGAYWTPRDAEVLDATRSTPLDVVRVDLRAAADKRRLLDAFAAALAFPQWFGGNWDALEECLGDLSWRKGDGWVLLIDGAAAAPREELETLREILDACAEGWAAAGKPFFAVFTGDGNALRLPELFQRRA